MSAAGDLIAERYRLVTKLGSGGMGEVWEAWDERLERRVAVKQLHPQRGLSDADAELSRRRAMREARINARLHHRHAVAVFDVVEHLGQPCLVMQYVPSVPLSALLKDGGPLEPDEAAQVGGQVGSALAAAHQAGIVHRDVKPGNILIADDGSALISDFGISHALGDATLTETGMVHGTPAYLAPEVARGGEAGAASDVFSLGATLYAALEGSPPFGTDQNSIALLHRVATGDFDPPVRSGALTPVLVEMLAGDPAARPTMATVVRRLAEAATGVQPWAPAPDEGDVPTEVARTVPLAVPPATVALTPVPMPAATPAPAATTPDAAGPATPMPVHPGPVHPEPAAVDPHPAAPTRRRRSRALTALVVVLGAAVIAVALALVWPPPGTTTADPPSQTSQPPVTSPTTDSSSADPTPTDDPSPTTEATPTEEPTPTDEATPTESTTPSASATPTPTTPTPSPTSTPVDARPTAAELAGAIEDYYALMPGGTDQAWSRMTSSYQTGTAGGRRSYDRFWASIRQVSATDVTANPPDRATATITYVARDGEVTRERTSFRLVRDDGVLKINSSTVL